MRDNVRFHSAAFAPREPESAQVNPARYGRELATWVATQLAARNIVTDPPIGEDWGWLVGARANDHKVQIACGNVDDSQTEWLIFVAHEPKGFVARLFGKPAATNDQFRNEVLAAIADGLRTVGDVSEIEWFRVDARGQEIDHASGPA